MNSIYNCLIFSGADRVSFLQGQLTQDVTRLGESGSLTTAWCSPKGRVIVTGRLIARPEAICLVLPTDSIDAVARRLMMYRLRAKVEIDRDDDWVSLALPAVALPESAPATPLTVVPLTADVCELHGSAPAFEAFRIEQSDCLTADIWERSRIEAGLVDINTENSERYTPHMLNLDRTGALSFDKGCYTGQEVVARTEHLGRVKRRVMRFGHEAGPVSIGDRLLSGDEEAGTVVNAAGGEILAVVGTGKPLSDLTVNGLNATSLPLPYSLD